MKCITFLLCLSLLVACSSHITDSNSKDKPAIAEPIDIDTIIIIDIKPQGK